MIELIMAYVLDQEGTEGSIEFRFRRFLLFVAQSGLKTQISFPENVGPFAVFQHPVVVLDPVCSANNVGARLSEAERREIVMAAHRAWETATFASRENDMSIWKELFGPRFKVED